MSDVKTGWLVDFEDKPFAPKTLISQVHDDTTGENLATKLTALDGKKVDKDSGKGLSTNDYTTTEKNKLSGIASGAEVNQNAFSNVKIGNTTVAAETKTDTLTLAGSNVTLTPDATNDKITIGITKNNVTTALGYTPPTTNTTYTHSSAEAGKTYQRQKEMEALLSS